MIKKKNKVKDPSDPLIQLGSVGAGPIENQAGGSVASLNRLRFSLLGGFPPQNTGSHGNLSLIHKSLAPIQSNLIPSLGRASSGPPTPHTPLPPTAKPTRLSGNLERILLRNVAFALGGERETLEAFWLRSPRDTQK